MIAYGAGWTDPTQQRPVGETSRHEPKPIDTIIEAELKRTLADPDPLRGVADLVARIAAASVLDPDGITRTKALGHERTARKLNEALPSGEQPLRDALRTFLRPMLSPRLAELHRDTFVTDELERRSTVDLAARTRDTNLEDLNLDDRPPA